MPNADSGARRDPFIDLVMASVDASIHRAAQQMGVMTLGALRDVLSMVPGDTPVVFDTGWAPAEVDSYRGYYERLAFEEVKEATASEVLATLNDADGRDFYGYKGGTYTMHAGTYLHVAPYGDCGPALVGIGWNDDRSALVIRTEMETF